MKTGTLYLVPNLLGAIPPENVLPAYTLSIARQLTHRTVENPKPARAFLKTLALSCAIADLNIQPLPDNGAPADPAALDALLAPCRQGFDLGLLSDAGCPGVADPGALLVARAHRLGLPIRPLVGPSSLLLALMGAGMNGQHFTFHGYLPIAEEARAQTLRRLENESRGKEHSTHLFIETPYRNAALIRTLLQTLRPETMLCIAVDLTLPSESIISRPIRDWRGIDVAAYQKRPAIFLLQAFCPGQTPRHVSAVS